MHLFMGCHVEIRYIHQCILIRPGSLAFYLITSDIYHFFFYLEHPKFTKGIYSPTPPPILCI